MRIQADPTFVPCPVEDGDEFYPNGIFVFNVTRIREHVARHPDEIAPGRFNLIDGHHRLEKARRYGVETLWAYRLTAAQHVRFLTSASAYLAFVGYWNGLVAEAAEADA